MACLKNGKEVSVMDKSEKGGEEVLQVGGVEHAFQWRQLDPSQGVKVGPEPWKSSRVQKFRIFYV